MATLLVNNIEFDLASRTYFGEAVYFVTLYEIDRLLIAPNRFIRARLAPRLPTPEFSGGVEWGFRIDRDNLVVTVWPIRSRKETRNGKASKKRFEFIGRDMG